MSKALFLSVALALPFVAHAEATKVVKGGIPVDPITSSQSASSGHKPVSGDKGWFFYDEEIIDLLTPEQKKKLKQKLEEHMQADRPFSTQWIRRKLSELQDLAIEQPTEQNILALEILKRIMLERSIVYARKTVEVMQKYPWLDDATYMPNSSDGYQTLREMKLSNLKKIFEKLSGHVGLWVFFDGSDLSKRQLQTLATFKRIYDFPMMFISLDGTSLDQKTFGNVRQGADVAKALGISQAPTIFALDTNTKTFYPISLNFVNLSEVERRLLLQAKLAGWITDEEFEMGQTAGRISPFRKIVYEMERDPEKYKSLDELVNKFKDMAPSKVEIK